MKTFKFSPKITERIVRAFNTQFFFIDDVPAIDDVMALSTIQKHCGITSKIYVFRTYLDGDTDFYALYTIDDRIVSFSSELELYKFIFTL